MKNRIVTFVAVSLLLVGLAIVVQAQQDQEDNAKPAPQQGKPDKPDSKPSEGKREPGGQSQPAEQQKEKRQADDQKHVQHEQQKQAEDQQKHAKQEQQKQASEQRERAQADNNDRQNDRHEAQGSRPGNPRRGARIPDDRFRAHFGRSMPDPQRS